jgi:hypothetical protein
MPPPHSRLCDFINISMLIQQHQLKNLSIRSLMAWKFIFSLGQVTYSPIIMVPQKGIYQTHVILLKSLSRMHFFGIRIHDITSKQNHIWVFVDQINSIINLIRIMPLWTSDICVIVKPSKHQANRKKYPLFNFIIVFP